MSFLLVCDIQVILKLYLGILLDGQLLAHTALPSRGLDPKSGPILFHILNNQKEVYVDSMYEKGEDFGQSIL